MTKQEAELFVKSLVKLRRLVTDEVSLQVSNLYPSWKAGVSYFIDDRVLYNGILYKVIIPHDSQESWTPDVSPSLFAKVLTSDADVILEWEQPESTNAYMINDKVYYNGKIYVSTIDHNIWSPEAYPAGWNIVE
jgi:hypothetical protein